MLHALNLVRVHSGSKYSTLLEFSNLKNSLKSGGSWIVALDDLPHQFERFHALGWRLRAPIFPLVRFVIERGGVKGRTVQASRIHGVHESIMIERRAKRC